ncbi:MAG: glycine cleavage system protein GcvH [Candidatus Nanoarchaeia archaeon]|nr:glycine cleavage system protein GcvH [Candidatus Nanoarchaeia archaeon]MDD5053774.1 glycine cleavage system protein GcvH [Candidatus Nanoarchaeia archaeon]MDD5499385.1 glycine cleavage system protein GcvH [Candidatus Nanoarchaeia archaeon]
MNFPKNLKYDKEHNWIDEKNGQAIIGMIEPSAKKTKEFIFINLPKKGEKIKKGQTYASLEAVKWAGNIKSPLSGEIIEINMKAYDEPSIINDSPYSAWLVKMKISNEKELKELMNSQEALKHYEKEFK